MKKILLSIGAIAALTSGANAAYNDFSYKSSTIGSYMFGIFGGGVYSDVKEEFYFEGGVNTFYMYELTERLNAGARGAIKYTSQDTYLYDEYKIDANVYMGYKITPTTNVYVGYGAEGWNEVEKDYFLVGADYFFSEDLMFELRFKSKNFTQFDNFDRENSFQLNAVIPFNFY